MVCVVYGSASRGARGCEPTRRRYSTGVYSVGQSAFRRLGPAEKKDIYPSDHGAHASPRMLSWRAAVAMPIPCRPALRLRRGRGPDAGGEPGPGSTPTPCRRRNGGPRTRQASRALALRATKKRLDPSVGKRAWLAARVRISGCGFAHDGPAASRARRGQRGPEHRVLDGRPGGATPPQTSREPGTAGPPPT